MRENLKSAEFSGYVRFRHLKSMYIKLLFSILYVVPEFSGNFHFALAEFKKGNFLPEKKMNKKKNQF